MTDGRTSARLARASQIDAEIMATAHQQPGVRLKIHLSPRKQAYVLFMLLSTIGVVVVGIIMVALGREWFWLLPGVLCVVGLPLYVYGERER